MKLNEFLAISGCKKLQKQCQKFIFDEYSDRMLMVCMRYVNNVHDAEELMMTGFCNFFKSIERFEYSGTASLIAWLKKIMVNECLMFLRRRKHLHFEVEHFNDFCSIENEALDKLSAYEILNLVQELPKGCGTVFNLFVVEGYSHSEIANLLDISVGTSKSQLNSARNMIKKRLVENNLVSELKNN